MDHITKNVVKELRRLGVRMQSELLETIRLLAEKNVGKVSDEFRKELAENC